MSEQPPYVPAEEQAGIAKQLAESNSELIDEKATILARIQTSEGGNPTIQKAREFGVSERELKDYAFRFLEKDIREGYSSSVIRSIAEQSGVVTETEANELYERIKAEMAAAGPAVETEDERIIREAAEAKWLAEMLEMCGE
jgi:hypothetical protein